MRLIVAVREGAPQGRINELLYAVRSGCPERMEPSEADLAWVQSRAVVA